MNILATQTDGGPVAANKSNIKCLLLN